MNSSANYRAALLTMSKVTAAFADAMEKCSGYGILVLDRMGVGFISSFRMKGPGYEAGTRLQAASGLHHLIGNHWHVLVSGMIKLVIFRV
jgi:hypothetical protein